MANIFKNAWYIAQVYWNKGSKESIIIHDINVGKPFERVESAITLGTVLGMLGAAGTGIGFVGHYILGTSSDQSKMSVSNISTTGNCSPNLIGNTNSYINCGGSYIEKPSISDIKDKIIDYNQFPGYDIQEIQYRNGRPEADQKYVVLIAVDIRMLVSCDEMVKPGWGDPGEHDIAGLAIGIAAIQIAYRLGAKCKEGEKYSLIYEDEFQNTENGWYLINQKSAGAERR